MILGFDAIVSVSVHFGTGKAIKTLVERNESVVGLIVPSEQDNKVFHSESLLLLFKQRDIYT